LEIIAAKSVVMPDPFSVNNYFRFFAKVKEAPPPVERKHLGNCWLWTACCNTDGYGCFHCPGFPGHSGKTVLAHRWATAFWFGVDRLKGLTFEHRCRRPACVNPRHGSAITRPENTAQGNSLRYEPLPEDPFAVFGI
jgi:hypothetical protein